MPAAKRSLTNIFPYLLMVLGTIGIICSLILIYDQVKVWQNPNYIPACSFNPVLSCGSVIDSKQGHIFGIPGPIWGLIAFPVLVTVGAAQLAGARFKRWFWLGLQAGVIGGAGFALWLFWLSLYRIHALCPFCLTVDAVMYTLVWYLTLYNIDQKHLALPKNAHAKSAYGWARRHHLDLLVLWILLVAAFILHHFWYYYGQHIHI